MYSPSSFQDRLLHLHYCSYGSYSFLKTCFKYDDSLNLFYKLPITDFVKLFPKRDQQRVKNIYHTLSEVRVDHLKLELDMKNIGYVTFFQSEYPTLLKEIYDPPWILYFKGNDRYLAAKYCLSVVGTRHPSTSAYDHMKQVLSPLASFPITIVSGMALGVDTISHELMIREKGYTIAVLAYGLDHLYPVVLRHLKEKLEKSQLIVSEYPPYVKPKRWQFPERNRIISGLSAATLVVEAAYKSGSLITSECALQQGRDVFAFPGRISDSVAEGTNRLIQQGAKLILSSEDIIEEYLMRV
ncbi:DNA-protecting protein DprA [Salipaludibacillus agaradhaerens]|nr:DNA-protecting protein DprA [Salipaludibacillus agaradhaerens]MCR6119114.1 DNA-protecting protein DprA [Salipaludibacillus agaradhaerens]